MAQEAVIQETAAVEVTEKVEFYQLGRVPFTFVNCDGKWRSDVTRLLPRYVGEPLVAEEVLSIKTGCNKEVRDLVTYLVRRHPGCIWIDASCLRTPSGRTVLIAGAPGSGKSTLALALAFGYDWKVVATSLF